jgi:hypothetical protein
MRLPLLTRVLVGAVAIAIAALSYWVTAKRPVAPRAEAAVTRVERHVPPQAAQAAQAGTSGASKALQVTKQADARVASAREGLAALRAPLSPESANDPFTVLSWLPPPPSPPPVVVQAPEPPPPPTAPPLPFVYLGTLNPGEGKPQVFVSNGDKLLIVSPGEVIDGTYRFDSIATTGALFTYLPLHQQQTMSVQGEGN